MKISWKICPHLTSCRVGCAIDVSIYTLRRSRSGFCRVCLGLQPTPTRAGCEAQRWDLDLLTSTSAAPAALD